MFNLRSSTSINRDNDETRFGCNTTKGIWVGNVTEILKNGFESLMNLVFVCAAKHSINVAATSNR